jgi:hypothetical protein
MTKRILAIVVLILLIGAGLAYALVSQRGKGVASSAITNATTQRRTAQVNRALIGYSVAFLRDNTNSDTFQFTSTGSYLYVREKDGFALSGTGTVRLVNGVLMLTFRAPDRAINAGFNTGQRTGSATITLRIAPGVFQTIRINSASASELSFSLPDFGRPLSVAVSSSAAGAMDIDFVLTDDRSLTQFGMVVYDNPNRASLN